MRKAKGNMNIRRLIGPIGFLFWLSLCAFAMGQLPVLQDEDDHRIKTVVIDAGHGGKDNGCSGKHSKEKHIALKLALKAGSLISTAYPDVNVIYTRDKDVFVELHERAAIANRAEADLFISIHCNAANFKAYGTETYVMGLHKEEANLGVAKRENASILLESNYEENYDGFDPNSPEGHILLTLFQHAYLDQSIRFAEKVEREFVDAGRRSRGVKQMGFLVLWKTAMPAVLIESGFLTNGSEEEFLRDENNQWTMAKAIYNAFSEYKAELEPDFVIKDAPETVELIKDEPKVQPNHHNHHHKEVPGLSFHVQVCAAKTSIPEGDARLKGMKNDLVEKREGPYFKYQYGDFLDLNKALDAQSELRSKHFPDCFVVAYYNGDKISIKQATALLH